MFIYNAMILNILGHQFLSHFKFFYQFLQCLAQSILLKRHICYAIVDRNIENVITVGQKIRQFKDANLRILILKNYAIQIFFIEYLAKRLSASL